MPLKKEIFLNLHISKSFLNLFMVLYLLLCPLRCEKLYSTESEKSNLFLSDSCVERLKKINQDSSQHLRILIEGGGCSGFQYKFDLDSTLNSDDR